MYVCLCNALTDTRIKAAIAAGADRVHDVYAGCGCQAQCGGCTAHVLDLLRAAPSAPSAGVAGD